MARRSNSTASGSHDDTRTAILRAATQEFAEAGPAGARTDSIARAAGVNKALLHYYFGSKEALYAAALELVFTGMLERQLAVLRGPGSAGQRLLRYFVSHFHYLASNRGFARMAEYEMMRARKGTPSHIPQMVSSCFAPLMATVRGVIEEGIGSGEFRAVDPGQFALSMTGVNVFYFIASPVMREITGMEPMSPEMMARRRAAILDLAAAALFADREHGLKIAAEVLAECDKVKLDATKWQISKPETEKINIRGKRQ